MLMKLKFEVLTTGHARFEKNVAHVGQWSTAERNANTRLHGLAFFFCGLCALFDLSPCACTYTSDWFVGPE